jgi:hypothetical protein
VGALLTGPSTRLWRAARPAPLVLRALRSTAISIVEKLGNVFKQNLGTGGNGGFGRELSRTETEHSIRFGTLINTNHH